jgi:hypothetical protein
MGITREQLHELLDTVPDDPFAEVQAVIAMLADPVMHTVLDAPGDDEPTTAERLAAMSRRKTPPRSCSPSNWAPKPAQQRCNDTGAAVAKRNDGTHQ